MRVVLHREIQDRDFGTSREGGSNLMRGMFGESHLRARTENGIPARPTAVAGYKAIPGASNPNSSLLLRLVTL
jgi:hypothetical protein